MVLDKLHAARDSQNTKPRSPIRLDPPLINRPQSLSNPRQSVLLFNDPCPPYQVAPPPDFSRSLLPLLAVLCTHSSLCLSVLVAKPIKTRHFPNNRVANRTVANNSVVTIATPNRPSNALSKKTSPSLSNPRNLCSNNPISPSFLYILRASVAISFVILAYFPSKSLPTSQPSPKPTRREGRNRPSFHPFSESSVPSVAILLSCLGGKKNQRKPA